MEMNESRFGFRAYFFNNMYLSSIAQGIQAAHCLGEMVCKYSDELNTEYQNLRTWLKDDKTMVILNAGYSSELIDLALFFSMPQNIYPWASFKESAEALNCATTSVGIVLPYKIYEGAKHINNQTGKHAIYNISGFDMVMYIPSSSNQCKFPAQYTEWEVELMKKISQYPLAR